MHKESYNIMKKFVTKFLNKNDKLRILDVGSYDLNGSYKPLFNNSNWEYVGLDVVPGRNVDLVSHSEYDFGIKQGSFDVVICGNVFEHVKAVWKLTEEIERVLKKGGLVCVIVPFTIKQHRFPIDCWRILPDGFRFLFEESCNFTILETKINQPKSGMEDTYLIAIKS